MASQGGWAGEVPVRLGNRDPPLRRETGVITLSRTDAALALLVRGLEAVEGKSSPR